MIFVDMDGVVADFDGHYEALFGVRPARWPQHDTHNWAQVDACSDFFLTIPMMADAQELLDGLRPREFTMLTGVPASVDQCANQKIEWCRLNIGSDQSIICCPSKDKYLHGRPGDILIDDWLRYRDRWVVMGGVFIHHTSARSSLEKLREWESHD